VRASPVQFPPPGCFLICDICVVFLFISSEDYRAASLVALEPPSRFRSVVVILEACAQLGCPGPEAWVWKESAFGGEFCATTFFPRSPACALTSTFLGTSR